VAEVALKQRVAGNVAGADQHHVAGRLLADAAVTAVKFRFAFYEAEQSRIRRDIVVPPTASGLCSNKKNAVAVIVISRSPSKKKAPPALAQATQSFKE
jgi:hypothetical protein